MSPAECAVQDFSRASHIRKNHISLPLGTVDVVFFSLAVKKMRLDNAQLFCEEGNRANSLHKNGVRLIKTHRRNGGGFPEDDMAVYEYLHKRAIEKAGEVGALQGMYRR